MNKGRKVFVVSKKKRGLSYQASQGIKKVEKFLKVFMISKKTKGAKLHKPHKGEQRQIFYDFKKQSSYTSKTTVLFQPSVQGVVLVSPVT